MPLVTTRRDDGVLVVAIANPPLNTLGVEVRRDLMQAIQAAGSESGVQAVVVRSEGRAFSAGADINEFGKPLLSPGLPELLDAVEASLKPVVAAIQGTALGGGLETALACHYRLAAPAAVLGLPEVKLGLLPGAGGTQRLPRVVGVEAALAMIVSGEPVSAERAAELGLVDRILAQDNLEAEAVAFAREAAGRAQHPVSSRRDDRLTAGDADAIARFRADNARKLKGLDAPAACIEAVEAATRLSYAEGAKVERDLFVKLVGGSQSKALRHVFFAERAAAKIDGLPAGARPLAVEKVGILGAGTMGGGIAMNFLSAGVPVVMVEREQGPLDHGLGVIRRNYDAAVRRGRMTGEAVDAAMGRLTPTLAYEDLADCDLVVEAVFEEMAVKKAVFARLDAVVKPGAILASNTSYLDIDEIATATGRPEHVLGLHFFSPANVMRLLEIVRGARTAPEVLATAMALARRIGKIAVVAGNCDGFIGNRMLKPRQAEANRLILEGAPYDRVDQVLLDFGFPMGPFQMADLAGLDLGWRRETSQGGSVRDLLCERDRRGQKNGRGFYDYDEKRNRTVSDEVRQLVAAFAAASGVAQREIGEDEIRERLLHPMVNEGALILEEGKAQRAGDIDVVWLNGYGWPARTGGPMFWADTLGLQTVLDGLERNASRLGPGLCVSDLLRRKAAEGATFTG